MAASSTDSGFFAYYREYAQSGIHAASAAALTAFGLLASTVNPWFVVPAIAIYVLPPVFLYLSGEGDRVPSVVGDEERAADTDERDQEYDSDTIEIDRHDDFNSTGDGTSTTDFDTVNGDSTAEVSDSGGQQTTDSDPERGWVETDTPTEDSLLDIVSTRENAYAVGEAGVVLTRNASEWETVLGHGPTAESNTLRGVDATEDDSAIWFAGDSGVLGRYDGERLTDHSAPEDQTSTWEDVAITGEAGAERIYLVNGSGELLRGEYGGTVEWDDIEKPGSGSSMTTVVFADDETGYICDTNQGVYETTDGGENWGEIGIEDANTDFTDVAAAREMVVVAGGDGSVFRYDGSVWTRLHAGSALSAIDLTEEMGLAAGDGGAVYELTEESWESVETPVDADLQGIVIGSDEQVTPAVAVGTDGTVIERR
ncbi:MAG TPA: hypothetical protein VFJ06_07295 [Halococcus sp.]|nr:hypothetical protein [Halococcus sp.]